MSISAAREARRENWNTYDEYATIDSMQPSDEWEGSRAVEDYSRVNSRSSIDFDKYSAPDDEVSYREPFDGDRDDVDQEQPHGQEDETGSYFAAPTREFVDYISHLTSSFSVEGSKLRQYGASYYSNATFSKKEGTEEKKEIKSKRSGSNHSRCIIENTESIQDRRDEYKQRRGRNAEGDDDDCHRDQQSTMSCSVEEISQISELTMDIPTIATEQPHKTFAHCAPTLPTISEVKQFQSPEIAAATCVDGVRNSKACSPGSDTTTNESEGNNDVMNFVFGLVEDALCTPMKTSKSERKKVFMEAFYEESEKVVKMAKKSGSKKALHETSKHSRSSLSTNHSGNQKPERRSPGYSEDEGSIMDPANRTNAPESSTHSVGRTSEHSRMKIVDKPPLDTTGFRALGVPQDEELTMDWSKMMSLAEKQLAAGEKHVGAEENSVVSRISAISRELSEKASFYTSIRGDQSHSPQTNFRSKAAFVSKSTNIESSPTSSITNSSSTHGTMEHSVVQELRELSALESSSFEEQSRFLLTSSLFRIMRHLIPTLNKPKWEADDEEEERAFDEVSADEKIAKAMSLARKRAVGPQGETFYDGAALQTLRIVAFFMAFVLWPYGVPRRPFQLRPLKTKKMTIESKPVVSLLQLVCENDA